VSAFSLGSRPARIARRPCFGPNCARPTNGESETRSVGEKSRQLGRAGARCRRQSSDGRCTIARLTIEVGSRGDFVGPHQSTVRCVASPLPAEGL
jgi:hypothetical protein